MHLRNAREYFFYNASLSDTQLCPAILWFKNLLLFERFCPAYKAHDRASLRAVQPRTQWSAGMQIPRYIFGPVYTYIFWKIYALCGGEYVSIEKWWKWCVGTALGSANVHKYICQTKNNQPAIWVVKKANSTITHILEFIFMARARLPIFGEMKLFWLLSPPPPLTPPAPPLPLFRKIPW